MDRQWLVIWEQTPMTGSLYEFYFLREASETFWMSGRLQTMENAQCDIFLKKFSNKINQIY